MKKIILTILSAITVISLLLTSCKKEELRPAPTISLVTDAGFTSRDTSLFIGDTVVIGLHCTSNGTDAIKTLTFYANDAMVNSPADIPANQSGEFYYSVKITKTDIASEVWRFEISDAQGLKSAVTITLNLSNNINKIWATIGAQQNTSISSYYSISTKLNYNAADAKNNQASIDFLGAYDATNALHIASPAAPSLPSPYDTDMANWTTKNNTKFCATTVTLKQFNELTSEDLLVSSFSTVATDQKNKAKSLKINDIYSFKTGNNKYGLFKVTSAATGITGQIAIEIKVQK